MSKESVFQARLDAVRTVSESERIISELTKLEQSVARVKSSMESLNSELLNVGDSMDDEQRMKLRLRFDDRADAVGSLVHAMITVREKLLELID